MKAGCRLWAFGLLACLCGLCSACSGKCGSFLGAQRMADGSTVVCEACMDEFSAKVVRVDPYGSELWSYRYPESYLDFPHSALWNPDDTLLIADTGHGRIILVDTATKEIVWTSEEIDFSDPQVTHNYANHACLLPSGNILASIRDGHLVLEFAFDGTIVWSFGEWGVAANDDTHLNGPHWPKRLRDGNTLIPDSWNHRVIEVSPTGKIVWEYAPTSHPEFLEWPRCAQDLPNGNVLITDAFDYWEVTRQGDPVKRFLRTEIADDWGYMAYMLENGNYMLCGWHRIDEMTPQGEVVWSYLSPWGASPPPTLIEQ